MTNKGLLVTVCFNVYYFLFICSFMYCFCWNLSEKDHSSHSKESVKSDHDGDRFRYLLCQILYLNVRPVLNGNLSKIIKLGLLAFHYKQVLLNLFIFYQVSTKPPALLPVEVYLHVVKWLQYYFYWEPRIFKSCLYHHHHSSKYSPWPASYRYYRTKLSKFLFPGLVFRSFEWEIISVGLCLHLYW